MSILTENIKLYSPFGNRQVLLNYILLLFCIIMIYASLLPVKLNGDTEILKDMFIVVYFILLFAMFSLGGLSSKIHLDILTKPFSTCLPDHYKNTGITVLITGITGNFFYSSICFIMVYSEGMLWPHYFINFFFSGLFVYFFTVLFFLYIKNEYKPYVNFTCIIIFYMLLDSILDGDIKFTFSEYISFSTIPFIIISIIMVLSIYMSMTRSGFKRRYFSGNNQLSFEPIDQKSTPKINEALRIKRLPEKNIKPDLLEKIFFKALKNTTSLSNARAVIAREYCTLDSFFTLTGWYSWIIILISFYLITAVLLMSMYDFSSEDMTGFYFVFRYCFLPFGLFFLCYKVVSGFTPVYHNHLLPVRRSDRFKNYLLLLLIQMVIAMLWIVLVIALSRIIEGNRQQDLIDNLGFIYKPLELSILLWPLVIIPVINAFMYFFEQPFITFTILLFLAVLLALSLYSFFGLNPFYTSFAMALAIVISNGFFIERLYRYWFKKDIELLD